MMPTGENSIIVTLGSNEQLGAKRAQELESVISQARMIMCQQEIDQAGNHEAFRLAKSHGGVPKGILLISPLDDVLLA